MNTTDKIITALTPGSIFNGNGLTFRSVSSLAQFAGIEEDEVLALLNGDLSNVVTCKPSTKGKGVLVALIEVLQQQQANEPVVIAAGPVDPAIAHLAEAGAAADADGPVAEDDPEEDAEEDDVEAPLDGAIAENAG